MSSRPDALLTVYDPETGKTVDSVALIVRPIVSDDMTVAVFALELSWGGVEVMSEWVGKEITLEVSPSAVTRDRMTAEILEVAHRNQVPVG